MLTRLCVRNLPVYAWMKSKANDLKRLTNLPVYAWKDLQDHRHLWITIALSAARSGPFGGQELPLSKVDRIPAPATT